MPKFVIFDLDGTLLDTLDDLHASVNATLTKFGYAERTREEVRAFVGNGIVMLMRRAVGEETPLLEEIVAEFKHHYGAHCAEKTKPYAGILELLSELKSRGIGTAVVSNKADFAVKLLAEEYFSNLLLSAVGEDEEKGIRKKPAPDSLLAVMRELGAAPEETVYVGDSEVDIQTAQNAGVACISVTWGFKDEEFLVANGAKIFARTPQEILKLCI